MLLQQRILRSRAKFSPRFTTIPVAVFIDGRTQVMKKKIGMSQTTNEILRELVNELAIPVEEEVELSFDAGNGDGISTLQGPECVFCIVMEHVKNTGYRLSEIQLEKIDAVPLIQCRLVLASAGNNYSSTSSIVSHFKRVLSRSESRRFFGRPLEGSSPPQPVLTMIDHLMLHGVDVEGLFRKSPKQSTVRMLRAQLDRGSVPDFYQFNPHVTAALLKEYLREIPGKLLLSGNFELWAAAMEQTLDCQKAIRKLLYMLPSAHSALLSKFLRLLRAIANSPQSKMTAQSLAVCIAPSLLDNPKGDSATSWLPDLAEYLIVNAPFLLEPFKDVQLAISSSVSNDSGLSDVDLCFETSVSNSDSGVIGSPASSCSLGVSQSPKLTYNKWEHRPLQTSSSGYFVSSISTEGEEEEIGTEVEQDDNDKTPVLSRENSDVQNKSISPMWKWKKSEEKRKIEEKLFSRGPSICSNSSKRNAITNDENNDKRNTEWKFRREFGTSSPCRRKIEGSPASLHRSGTLESSPSSNRKSVIFDPESPVLARKSSTISTASLHSDSTLQTLVPTDLPESPILLRRGSSKRADRSPIVQRKTANSMIDSGIHFASPLPPRRRELEAQGLSSPLNRRKDLETSSYSPVIRRKESLLSQTRHESFRRQSENSNGDPGPSSIRDNVTRKYSFPEGKICYVDEESTYYHSAEGELLERKSFQMPVIASPILRTSNTHNKLLVRRASERIGSAEAVVSKLLSRQSPPLKSDAKQSSVSVIDLHSIASKSDANSPKDITVRSNPENHNRNSKVEVYITSNTEFRYSTVNEIRKAAVINANSIQPKLPKQPSIKEANKCSSTEATATSVKNDIRSRVPPQQREPTVSSSSVRIRKKTRSILMEPLEVNWSVDELRSKFQKTSEPPPLLDTIYSSYSLK
ncbi:RhoGAP domain-containing protein [Loa loa]|uniref:RhoGAP domain-containing protein n=1 Tax=Loa loa TaxID=7209 RepID=A0A1I7VCY3_LOALO|nr:RhoGAP domain-containing protein [Loa loa]EFO22619.1 RhoGAP domain-containing protein [Loa loa]